MDFHPWFLKRGYDDSVMLTAAYSQAEKAPEGPHWFLYSPGLYKGFHGLPVAFSACEYIAVSIVESS